MDDAINTIRAMIEKASARVDKHQKAYDSAKNELSDLETALRVMEGLRPDSTPLAMAPGTGKTTAVVGGRQLAIVGLMPEGMNNAETPLALYDDYKSLGDDISLDTFRTTIWRMAESSSLFRDERSQFWRVYRADGRYWKELASKEDILPFT